MLTDNISFFVFLQKRLSPGLIPAGAIDNAFQREDSFFQILDPFLMVFMQLHIYHPAHNYI